MTASHDYDYIVIGGGFYGCCLALFLRSVTSRILLVEAGDTFLMRASRVNQARVHTGFHYPRSFVTAARSAALSDRFAQDFPEAVVDDFRMLYAIARSRSKVSAGRFFRMFHDLKAPIRPAREAEAALFDRRMIEETFACREHAFDYSVLQHKLTDRVFSSGIEVRMQTSVVDANEEADAAVLHLSDGSVVRGRRVFNVTYAQINQILRLANLPLAPVRYEFTEIALVEPPHDLEGLGVTVMDGAFFSVMPYPAAGLYSLTHVRYTPHASWLDTPGGLSAYEVGERMPRESRVRHMLLDSQRYLPCLADMRYVRSLYDVKAVLLKNERDDGRPILFQRNPSSSHITSVMGGKIDNIYDLFVLLKREGGALEHAHHRLLLDQPGRVA